MRFILYLPTLDPIPPPVSPFIREIPPQAKHHQSGGHLPGANPSFAGAAFLEKAKGSKSPVANGSLEQWEKLLCTGTRVIWNPSCWCLCCSVAWFAAHLCGPWGCALCDLSQSQPVPPQQAVKDALRQAASSCSHPGTASNIKWGKGSDVAVIFGKQCSSSAA